MRTVALLIFLLSVPVLAENWSEWRGPNQNGASTTAHDLPVQWDTTNGVKWRVKLESWSAATPIIWNDVVFVTSAEAGFNDPLKYGEARGGPRVDARPEVNSHDKLFLFALDRNDGSVLWKRETGDKNKIYRKHNLASPSPVTDGTHIWTMTGGGDVRAFDFDGNVLWGRDLEEDYGQFGLNWGYASSPRLHDGRL